MNRYESSMSTSSRSHRSDESYHSRSTDPTDISDPQYATGFAPRDSAHSVDTYTSTDEEELAEEEEQDRPRYDVPIYVDEEPYPGTAIPTTPKDFEALFPSTRRLTIRHDDTIDGNMNLRVDVGVTTKDEKLTMTLFHLRMHDLKSRAFSLRRYCRESGREVCHSTRKYQAPPPDRPSLQRSMSSALSVFRNKPDSRPPTSTGLKREDSGYASFNVVEDDASVKELETSRARQLMPTQTIKLEFSNYAHVNLKRRGTGAGKRYGFEYWGVQYNWRRTQRKFEGLDQVSYHLMEHDSDRIIAHIVPMRMSPAERHEEAAKGGWIPPCYFKIVDKTILRAQKDISDTIVSTGLMALVDDNIKSRFHSKATTQLQIPIPLAGKLNVDYIGPKRLIDRMYHRT